MLWVILNKSITFAVIKLKAKSNYVLFTRDTVMNISVYKELLLKTITRILAEKNKSQVFKK